MRKIEHAENASGSCSLELSRKRHLDWSRLFGNDPPTEKLTSHCSAIFGFHNLEEAARESAVRQSLVQRWLSRLARSDVFVCDLPSLERALKRLHLEKSSADGQTAEMLRQLPEN